MSDIEKGCLTLREVAEYLGVHYNTIYRMVRRGDLRAARVGHVYVVRQGDVDALFEGK